MDTVLHIGLSNAVVASALALVAVVVGYFCRRPALVHGLWLLVLLKLFTPPLVAIPIAWPEAESTVVIAAPVVEPADIEPIETIVVEPRPVMEEEPPLVVLAPPEAFEPEAPASAAAPPAPEPFPWQTLVAGVWLAGSAGWFLLAGWRLWRFHRLLRFATPAPMALRKTAERLAQRMQLPACPAVYLIPGRIAPMLWAAGGAPLLLVPRQLLGQLTGEQLETLLVHELAHLRRRDHWVRGLEFLAMGLYWWNPIVWYARRALREAEEQCCDAWVVSLLPGAGKTYATALLETLDFLSESRPPEPLLASGIGHVADLKRRLTMIMCGTTPRGLTWRGTLAVLALGLFALPLLPTLARAQTEEVQKELELKLAAQRREPAEQKDAGQAQAELERARAEVARMKAQLDAKANEIKAIEAKLAASKSGKPEEKRTIVVERKAEAKHEPIEITLRKVGDKWEVVQAPRTVIGERREFQLFRIEEKDGVLRVVPATPGVPPVPAVKSLPPVPARPPAVVAPVAPLKPAPEGRIDSLERQLQQIMRELESLRKEMKPRTGSGGGGSTSSDDALRTYRFHIESLEKNPPPGIKVKVEEKDGVKYLIIPRDANPTPEPRPQPRP